MNGSPEAALREIPRKTRLGDRVRSMRRRAERHAVNNEASLSSHQATMRRGFAARSAKSTRRRLQWKRRRRVDQEPVVISLRSGAEIKRIIEILLNVALSQ